MHGKISAMTNAGLRDTIGQRGEALFYVILTKLYGRARPLFKPQFLGDKWPTVDFIVELIDYSIEVVPYFFVQVKTTQQGYTKRNRRLKIRVSASDARRLASFPAPTYVVGIDEVNEVAYITSVSGRPRHGLKSLSTQFPINEQTQNALYEEVEQFWRDFSQSGATSRFTDPRWR